MLVAAPELTDGYGGLFGEVVTEDCYRLRTLDFVPDVVFDLGANIGVFARFARELWPDALIVCVEPNAENLDHLNRFTPPHPRTVMLNKAIGRGRIWRGLGAANGAHESYMSAGLGFDEAMLTTADGLVSYPTMAVKDSPGFERADVPTVMLDELVNEWVSVGARAILKLDIEGGENALVEHEPSVEALRRFDYIAAEIHLYTLRGGNVVETNDRTVAALKTLEPTHDCAREHVMFYARRRNGA